MRLLCLAPDHPRFESIAYALGELARRIGASQWRVARAESDTARGDADAVLAYGPAAYTGSAPCARIGWSGFFDGCFGTPDSLPDASRIESHEYPALYWERDGARAPNGLAQPSGNRIFLAQDFAASTYFALSGHEERFAGRWDEHGRFAAADAFAVRAGLIERPFVDGYALRLAEAFRRLGLRIGSLPRWPDGACWAALMTSDIDLPRRNTWKRLASRLLGRDWIPPGGAAPPLTSLAPWAGRPDPYAPQGFLERLGGADARWTFFFLAGTPSRMDAYDLARSPALADQAQRLADQGHEIALHVGYERWQSAAQCRQALDAFERATGIRPAGSRQHYMRGRVPQAWRALAEAGLGYEATAGFAGREGFRFGTALPFQAFDSDQEKPLPLWIVPLAAIDIGLRVYRRLSPEEAEASLDRLRTQVRRAGGGFALLWHNSSADEPWKDWIGVPANFLRSAIGDGAWTPTIGEWLARWRETTEAA